MGFLAGKRALIVGLASNRSIAWGIAQAMHREGAILAFTYQNDKLASRVEKMAAECNSSICLPCDVGSDDEIAREWYRKAAENGHKIGQWNYGVFLFQGRGGPANRRTLRSG